MGRDKRLTSAALVALATVALSGCGADDATPSASSSSQAVANSGSAAVPTAPPIPRASSPLVVSPASAAAASDPIAQSMQAALAADNRQVAPVMHYAPGDSASSN